MAKYKWINMTDAEKLDMFSKIFDRSATELRFRERLLASESSAIAAFAEEGNIELPPDFRITFIDQHDSEQETKRVILRLPKFQGDGTTLTKHTPADETNVLCTYPWWGQKRKQDRQSKK